MAVQCEYCQDTGCHHCGGGEVVDEIPPELEGPFDPDFVPAADDSNLNKMGC